MSIELQNPSMQDFDKPHNNKKGKQTFPRRKNQKGVKIPRAKRKRRVK